MHAVISLLLLITKQEILVISLTYCLLRCCFTTSYCCQQYAKCLVTAWCSSRTVHRHTVSVQ